MEEERVSTGRLFEAPSPTGESRTWNQGDHLYRMEAGLVTIALPWGRIAGDREGLNTLRTVVRPGRIALGQARESTDVDRPGESAGEPAEGRP